MPIDPLDHDPTEPDDRDFSALVSCPYCGAEVEIMLDPDGGSTQRYVEDCEVCCNPWQVVVRYQADGSADVSVLREAD